MDVLQSFISFEFGKKSVLELKGKICQAIEADGIPYTYVSNKFLWGYFLPTLALQPFQG
jgi:hypothetical protein